ncbi:MAG TPA: pyridoxine 5'-phosphate synthase [Kaistiaceae bacterium]|nr:pyridoxine 5'-phosphate synthase [Kaistiaceae bacterium]
MTTHLSVNLNAIAQLRNRRDLPWPSVTGLGRIALEAGAHGLTVHPRPDERHIRRSDVAPLAALVAEYPGREFNIEGYPDDRFMALVEEIRPHQVTLVPDDPSQPTSDHGWDVAANEALLKDICARLKTGGMRISIFIDADPAVPALARAVGADRVELYTGPYGGAHSDPARAAVELEKLVATAEAARDAGLEVNAGHDLTTENLPALVAAAPFIAEVSIGHGLTADALIWGMEETVKRYVRAAGSA